MLFYMFDDFNMSPEIAVLYFAIGLFVIIFSLTVHEFAHALAAVKMGDITPKAHGRLTLNPFQHIDFLGFLSFMFLGIGWAKPVPINPLNFKKYRSGTRLVSIIGVLSNLILAIVAALIHLLVINVATLSTPVIVVLYILQMFILVNSSLAIINFIPIFPLDGFNFVASFMKTENAYIRFNAKHGYKVMIALLMVGLLTEILFNFNLLEFIITSLYRYVLLPLSYLGV